MNRIQSALLALFADTRVGNALGALFNRYEAAQVTSPERSYLPAFVRDARIDANSWSRWEMFRKIGWHERNTWLVGRITEERQKWTVGPAGLPVIPATSDHEWNKRALEAYHDWCEAPFLDSTLTMSQGHRLMAGNESLYGEMFILATGEKLSSARQTTPKVQFIESWRCSTPGTEYSWPSADEKAAAGQGAPIVDGVQLGRDASGKVIGPIGYHIRDTFEGDKWQPRSKAEMLHVADPNRIGMYRCVTPYHAVLNTLTDVADLETMEMQRAKANAEVANILTNPAGEMDPQNLMRERFRGKAAEAPATAEDLNKRLEMYRKILGSRTIALKTGETLQQFDSKTPSAATQWYWTYKIGQICSAQNVPLILIFPELAQAYQGTVVRGIYDNAHQFFRAKSHLFAHAAKWMYRHWANWARYNDPRCFDAPADWMRCTVSLPRAVNVDVGRNAAADMASLAAGTKSYDDIYGAEGSTAEVGLTKKALNVAMIKRIAREVSKQTGEEVTPEEIAIQLGDAKKLALTQPQEQEPDDDETKIDEDEESEPEESTEKEANA